MMRTLSAVLLATSFGTTATGQDAVQGHQLFQEFCAVCHGHLANGRGPMASALKVPPPDLTGLAKRSSSRFPITDVLEKIDGRNPIVSHGSQMPIYGHFFEGTGAPIRNENGVLIMTSQPLIDIVAWLEEIQEKSE